MAHVRYLAIATGIQAVVTLTVATVPVLAPSIIPELGMGAHLVGYYAALTYAIAMNTALLGGRLVDRHGALRITQISLLTCALGLLVATHGSLAAFALSAVLIGAGMGPVTPAGSALLARVTPVEWMALSFSIRQSGVPAGVALAGAIVPSLTLAVGWRGSVAAVALTCVVLAVSLEGIRAGADHVDRSGSKGPDALYGLRFVLTDPGLAVIAVASFFFAGIQHCFITYATSYFTGEFHLSLPAAGVLLTIAQLAGISARLAWGLIADRWIRGKWLLVLSGFGMAAAACLLGSMTEAWPYLAMAVVSALFGATGIGWNGVYLNEVARIAGRERIGLATGGTLFFTYLGMVINPLIFGQLVTHTHSYAIGFITIAVPVLISTCFVARMRPSVRL